MLYTSLGDDHGYGVDGRCDLCYSCSCRDDHHWYADRRETCVRDGLNVVADRWSLVAGRWSLTAGGWSVVAALLRSV
jgi:hypothetical protein